MVYTFAAAKFHHQGRRVACRDEGGGSLPLSPRLRPAALSGVNCTACESPLRGLGSWPVRRHDAMESYDTINDF